MTPDPANGATQPESFRWLTKGFWAVMDQFLYGGGNFVLTVLLARWLSEQGYGAFAVAFSAFIFVLALHASVIVEPMLVFGPGRYAERFADYLGVLLDLHVGFSAVGSLLLLIVAGMLLSVGSAALGTALVGLGLAAPFMMFSLLMRRACYVHRQPRLAAGGGAVYIVGALLGAYLLARYEALSSLSVFLVMGGAGLIAGLSILFRLGVRWRPFRQADFNADVLRQHWGYGRWAAASRLPMRASSSIVIIVLPLWAGLAAAGAFQASLNLILPATQINAALGFLLLPTLARHRGTPQFFQTTRQMLLLFGVSAALYWLLLARFGGPAMDLLYDGRYTEHAQLLWVLGALPVLAGGIEVLASALRASQQPDWIFWSYTAAVVVALPVALGLVAARGLDGAALGTVILSAATALALAVAFFRLPAARVVVGEARPVEAAHAQPAPREL